MKILKLFTLLLVGFSLFACDDDDDYTGDWSKGREFGGVTRVGAVSFQIGNNVYVGLGYDGNRTYGDKEMRDFWRFRNNNWVKVDSFPGDGRFGAVAFVVDGKAYVGTGFRPQRSLVVNDSTVIQEKRYYSDFYVFDGTTETWEKDSLGSDNPALVFPGAGREHAVAFSVGGYGFVGTGAIDDNTVVSDFYKFDPSSGWSTTDYPCDSRRGATAFVIDDFAIVCTGTGTSSTGYKVDVAKYDATTDTWSTERPLVNRSPNSYDDKYGRIQRAYGVSFTSTLDASGDIPTRGYVALGAGPYPRTVWRFNPNNGHWSEATQIPSAMSSPRVSSVSFMLNQHGYITTGGTSIETAAYQDTWMFTPGVKEDDDNDYSIVDW